MKGKGELLVRYVRGNGEGKENEEGKRQEKGKKGKREWVRKLEKNKKDVERKRGEKWGSEERKMRGEENVNGKKVKVEKREGEGEEDVNTCPCPRQVRYNMNASRHPITCQHSVR